MPELKKHNASADAAVPIPAAAHGGPISHAIFRVARLHRMIAGNLLRRVGLHPLVAAEARPAAG